jgi:hypothetical protein
MKLLTMIMPKVNVPVAMEVVGDFNVYYQQTKKNYC